MGMEFLSDKPDHEYFNFAKSLLTGKNEVHPDSGVPVDEAYFNRMVSQVGKHRYQDLLRIATTNVSPPTLPSDLGALSTQLGALEGELRTCLDHYSRHVQCYMELTEKAKLVACHATEWANCQRVILREYADTRKRVVSAVSNEIPEQLANFWEHGGTDVPPSTAHALHTLFRSPPNLCGIAQPVKRQRIAEKLVGQNQEGESDRLFLPTQANLAYF